ncbi:LysR family transcriptional regulator [Haliea atlantica]|jgi:DNA-binding transcriptional LysR family regulator
MNSPQLHKVDLNLLVALQVMLQECSVSRAARRLHITQPAMSRTLGRLRELFDDPLFTRSSGGMQPSPRARELERELGPLLTEVERLLRGPEFDPWHYTGEVTLALSEYIGMALLPGLIRRLHELAPRLSIRVITRVENQLEQLASGALDFVIHIAQAHYPEDFRAFPLGTAPPAILVREGHPLTQGDLTWERLALYPVIRVYLPDFEQIELVRTSESFLRVRDPQQGSLEISHLMTALEVLRSTDYFMPGPAYIMRNQIATQGIVALANPEDIDYQIRYMLVGHRRTEHSALHQWLWQQILETLGSLDRP